MKGTDLGLLLLRVVTGGTLIAHGYTKLFGGEGSRTPEFMTRIYGTNFPGVVEAAGINTFAQTLEQLQVPYPTVAAYLAGLAEFGGGLALLAGAFTRLAALAVMINMFVAIRKVHWQTGHYGQGGYEFPAQLFAAAGAFLFAGPGAFSVDCLRRAIRGTRNQEDE